MVVVNVARLLVLCLCWVCCCWNRSLAVMLINSLQGFIIGLVGRQLPMRIVELLLSFSQIGDSRVEWSNY